jgi:hypothetical protein
VTAPSVPVDVTPSLFAGTAGLVVVIVVVPVKVVSVTSTAVTNTDVLCAERTVKLRSGKLGAPRDWNTVCAY